jgi:hypothetical protein
MFEASSPQNCLSESITSKDWLEATKNMTIHAYSPFATQQDSGEYTKATFERDLNKTIERKQSAPGKTQT